ncbi:MAG: hypothetical protein DI536_28885 [Archangium gephyra]|uniref:Head-tail adaptor protein n=1 Tax=Archangium gephyra TaxID=48 RepID=A0A2W5UUR1_9BACT|nr:MAG: hypothetical protein DI536_28885 [Archangium gephyra]
MTASGPMREVIHLQAQTELQDDTGQRRLIWNDVAVRRAEVTQSTGSEVVTGAARAARVPTIFRIRYPREFEVTPAMRVVNRGRVFNIISRADADGRRVELVITAEELVGEAP